MIYILMGDGFEEKEAVAPIDILRRAGLSVTMVSLYGDRLTVTGSHGITVECAVSVDQVSSDSADMLILPGGVGGVREISSCKKALELITDCSKKQCCIAAICAAPTVLSKLGLLRGVTATCYPTMKDELEGCIVSDEKVCVCGRIVTAEAAGSAVEFGLALVSVLKGASAADEVRGAIYA